MLFLLLVIALLAAGLSEGKIDSRVEDRLAIQDLLVRYCSAVDSRNWQEYRSLFTSQATVDYTANLLGTKGTPQQVSKDLASSMDMFSVTVHQISNIQIDFSSNITARTRSMLTNPMYIVGFPVFPLFTVRGYYHHTVEKTEGGEWKITLLREDITVHWEHQCVALLVLFVLFWRTRNRN